MNSSVLELITIGLSIKIGRSDGRVHAANVKDVHPEKGAVSVEWQEGSASKGKEVEINELCSLNRELIEYLKSSCPAAPVPKQLNKYETRLRSSRIPALTEATDRIPPSEASVGRRLIVRRTGVMSPVIVAPQPVSEAHTVTPEQPMSSLKGPGMTNSQKKHSVFAMPSLPRVSEEAMESEAVAWPRPNVRSKKRMSQVPLEAEKMVNKREASQAKNAEIRTKRGKDVDTNRPHWQFYKMIEEYRQNLETSPISTMDPVEDHRICVCVRKRPLNTQEVAKKEIDVVTVPGKGVMLIHEPKKKVDLTKYLENQMFNFDYSFDETATNDTLYNFTAKPLVKTIFEGGMATCFAYGQTGSGKTHTMGGDFSGKTQNSARGIYALAAQDMFTLLHQRRYSSMDLDPYVTFFEIYNGKVFDLLNKKARLRVLEDGKQQVQVVGLQEMYVSSASDVIKMIKLGSACRTSGKTFANANSSRSHAVLQIILRQGNKLHGKFSLVDLAGNERGTDVKSNDRQTLVETAEINQSLLALKECVRSLGKNKDHIPFRMSKLTQVLRDSFIGENSRTCMIAMISPGMSSCDYTLNTLRYADRVKELHGATNANDSGSDKKTEVEVDEESLSEDDTDVHRNGLYEAVCQVTVKENEVSELLERANEIVNALRERTAANIVAVAADLVDYAKKLQDSAQGFQAAVMMEECARI